MRGTVIWTLAILGLGVLGVVVMTAAFRLALPEEITHRSTAPVRTIQRVYPGLMPVEADIRPRPQSRATRRAERVACATAEVAGACLTLLCVVTIGYWSRHP